MSSSSTWTSKDAVMRDLSKAQGIVPVEVDVTLAGEKPPAYDIKEDTEEEYFQHCTGGGEFNSSPDLTLIKQMLDMVRELEVDSEPEVENTDLLVISKLNPMCNEFVPKNMGAGDATPSLMVEEAKDRKPVMLKKKRERNVALASILKAKESISLEQENGVNHNGSNGPIKLVKPNDYILKEDKSELTSVEKVDDWLEKRKKILTAPTSMFRRKNVSTDSTKSTENMTKSSSIKSSSPMSDVYRPSHLAAEYYKVFVERSQTKEIPPEDIWTKAKRQMKELDAKRQLENPSSSPLSIERPNSNNQPSPSANDSQIPDKILLPQHRHLLTGECIVCKVLCKTD